LSLDAEHTKLTDTGSITISDDKIAIAGFSGDNCTCRDVAVYACLWAIGELQKEVTSLVEQPGGGRSYMAD